MRQVEWGKIITHEEIVGVWRIASHSKKLHQVVELAMDITTYLTLMSDEHRNN
jgi:hypothetical protein